MPPVAEARPATVGSPDACATAPFPAFCAASVDPGDEEQRTDHRRPPGSDAGVARPGDHRQGQPGGRGRGGERAPPRHRQPRAKPDPAGVEREPGDGLAGDRRHRGHRQAHDRDAVGGRQHDGDPAQPDRVPPPAAAVAQERRGTRSAAPYQDDDRDRHERAQVGQPARRERAGARDREVAVEPALRGDERADQGRDQDRREDEHRARRAARRHPAMLAAAARAADGRRGTIGAWRAGSRWDRRSSSLEPS